MSNVNPKRQRQKELRRQKLEQQKKAELARKRRIVLLVTLLAGAVVALVLFRPEAGDDPEASASPTPSGDMSPPAAADPSKPLATLTTSLGEIQIELASDTSPNLVAAFIDLVNQDFYDGLTFHRIVDGFAIQGGDPKGDGTGGPDTKTVDEVPADFTYTRGTVAMAKAASEPPGTAGSQFFIVPGDGADDLPPEYAVLGRVVSGLDTVDALNAVEVEANPATGELSKPLDPPIIQDVTVTQP